MIETLNLYSSQRWLERRYTPVEKGLDGDVLQLDYKSCEMIADDLATVIQNKYLVAG